MSSGLELAVGACVDVGTAVADAVSDGGKFNVDESGDARDPAGKKFVDMAVDNVTVDHSQ